MLGPPQERLIAALPRADGGVSQAAILDAVRTVILDGVAPPGTPIPVDTVAAHFGVSRIPVREALKTLVGEGIVDHRANGGYSIARLTAAELAELYLVRGALETAAHGIALPAACADDDAQAQSAYIALDRAVLADDVTGYHQESRAFHLALVRPCRMQRLLHVLESTWNITEPGRPMWQLPVTERVALHLGHADMLSAFLARDADALAAATTEHNDRLRAAIATSQGPA
ncbi:GntR family transcriptional regulator [Williamsia deligens]|uniref:GntR family transcriptional regulator n=1 Tax=Williamsia deligens TaxID=321325 RepID=A0ABW3G9S9_9NOCA|nr:GntR family transcriptional regulator [Williamsia deligens]MCP2193482.1 transcriptional regulator, GntR family [Williamsia deligens]